MKSTTKVFIIAMTIVLAVLLPVVVTPVLASSGAPAQAEPPPAIDIMTFFKWLASSGGSIIAVSWLLERAAWFQAFSSNKKDNVIFGASVAVACVALAVITYVPAAILAVIAPYFLIISGTFVTVFIAKTFHRADKSG